MSTWSREQVSILLEEYQKHECLYAVKSTAYNNRYTRTSPLEQIQKDIMVLKPDVTIGEINNKINGSRTTFLAEYRKYETHSRSGMSEEQIYQPTIWYFQNMFFIRDHCQVRRGIDTIRDPAAESVVDMDSAHASSQEFMIGTNGVLEPTEDSENISSPSTSQHTSAAVTNNKRKRIHEESKLIQDASSALRTVADRISQQEPEDEVGYFISKKLKLIKDPHLRVDVESSLINFMLDYLRQYYRREQ